MSEHDEMRRRLIKAMALAPLAIASPVLTQAACATTQDPAGLEPTPAQTEGPFFTPSSPQRASLLGAGLRGTTLIVSGLVLTRSCVPVAGALLDFWQADDGGAYDNEGFRLRGHQFTNAHGVFRLETIVPGLYPGRTRHIHVKVQAPARPILTTQLYFPGESRNASDGIFRPELLMSVGTVDGVQNADFSFVLDVP